MVKAVKAKRGFVAKRKSNTNRPTIKKKQPEPVDSIEALIQKSATALSLTQNSAKADGGKASKRVKPKRSVQRKAHKTRVAAANRKQRRKGIN